MNNNTKKCMIYVFFISFVNLQFLFAEHTLYENAYILIDPGHGGDKIGTHGTGEYSSVYERDLVMKWGEAYYSSINNSSGSHYNALWEAFLTRDNNDDNPDFTLRAQMANVDVAYDGASNRIPTQGMDLTLSIHCNGGSETARGTEAYIFHTNSAKSPADVYNTGYFFENSVLASLFLHHYIKSMNENLPWYSTNSRWIKYFNTKASILEYNYGQPTSDSYDPLRMRKCVLFETDFLPNPDVAKVMVTREYKDALVEGFKNVLQNLDPFLTYDYTLNVIDDETDVVPFNAGIGQTILFRNTSNIPHGDNVVFAAQKTYDLSNDLSLLDGSALIVDDKVTVTNTNNYNIYVDSNSKLIVGKNSSFPSYNSNSNTIITPIEPNTLLENVLNSNSDSKTYQLNVQSGAKSLYVRMDPNANADFDIYGKHGSAPTTTSFTFSKKTRQNGGFEEVTHTNPQAGSWYIMVDSYNGSGKYELDTKIDYGNIPAGAPTIDKTTVKLIVSKTSATISWKTNIGSDSFIYYRRHGDLTWKAKYWSNYWGGRKDHEIKLTNLDPVTEYDFKIGTKKNFGPEEYEQGPKYNNAYVPNCPSFKTSPTKSGNLPYNEIWSGPVTLTNNVTIPAGDTLTIEPGATINVPAGKKIIVKGTLIAKGTSSQRIRFNRSGTSRWYGIWFENSSDDQKCILEYCNIINAIYGVYCRSASPKIINCNLNSNMLGIYCYNLSTEQTIQYNNISNNSTWGFYCITPVMPKSNIII